MPGAIERLRTRRTPEQVLQPAPRAPTHELVARLPGHWRCQTRCLFETAKALPKAQRPRRRILPRR
eukprot:2622218-Alexandrium_andersonii.AAC.1